MGLEFWGSVFLGNGKVLVFRDNFWVLGLGVGVLGLELLRNRRPEGGMSLEGFGKIALEWRVWSIRGGFFKGN